MSLPDNKTPAAEQAKGNPSPQNHGVKSDSPVQWGNEAMEAPQLADVLGTLSDVLDWYDAMDPTEAARRVAIDRAALLRIPSLGGLDITTATKH